APCHSISRYRHGSRSACAARSTATRSRWPHIQARSRSQLIARSVFMPTDAAAVLAQIEGAIAYVDTLAPGDVDQLRRLRATLEAAYDRLHRKAHAAAIFHHHAPCHDHHTRNQ